MKRSTAKKVVRKLFITMLTCLIIGLLIYYFVSQMLMKNVETSLTVPRHQVLENIRHVLLFIAFIVFIFMFILIAMYAYGIYLRYKFRKQKQISDLAVKTANILIIGLDSNWRITSFNKFAEVKTGYRKDEVVEIKTFFDLVSQDSLDKLHEMIKHVKDFNPLNNCELTLIDTSGNLFFAQWNVNISSDLFGNIIGIQLIGIDITDRVLQEQELIKYNNELSNLYNEIAASEEELKQQNQELIYNQQCLEKSEERYRLSSEGSNDVLWDWQIESPMDIYFSDRWYDILGYKKEDFNANIDAIKTLIEPKDYRNTERSFYQHLKGEKELFETELRLKDNSGEYRWFYVRGKALLGSTGMATRIAGSITDITEKKRNEEYISNLAYYDILTGLSNRIHLEEQITHAINKTNNKIAVLFIDIDNFKYINDFFGHSFGDSLLIQVGRRLTTSNRYKTLASRLGGDEFIVMAQIDSREDAQNCAEEILESIGMSFEIGDVIFNIYASIGISVYPNDGINFEELLKTADIAMYKAKQQGKNRYVFFDKSMSGELLEKMIMENDLKNAIDNNELIAYYQPLYNMKTGEIAGFEALARWNSPKYGFIQPKDFIPLAEEMGFIVSIDRHILKMACTFLRELHDKGFSNLIISVNISVIQLFQDDFDDMILEIVQNSRLNPKYLIIEITESVMMENFEHNIGKIENIRANGVSIALDDFGKGYSSLTYLRDLPINFMKLDKAFIDDIDDIKSDKQITESIIRLAHNLDLGVIAEGVETKEQLEYLLNYKCDMAQGFLMGKPMSESGIRQLLEKK
ncbi:MAG TPA: EAL domain-containing protein [Clostridiales bacterium]|nr:EAL domain-containing protein [Clostridiales bacterium]